MGFEQTCDGLGLFCFGLWSYFCFIYKTTQVFLFSCRFQSEQKKKKQKPKKQQHFFPKVIVTQLFWKSELLWAVSSLYRCAEIGCHRLSSERLVNEAHLACELLRGMCHSRLSVKWNIFKQPKQSETFQCNDNSIKYKDARKEEQEAASDLFVREIKWCWLCSWLGDCTSNSSEWRKAVRRQLRRTKANILPS